MWDIDFRSKFQECFRGSEGGFESIAESLFALLTGFAGVTVAFWEVSEVWDPGRF